MTSWELLDEKKGELDPWLQRSVWLPLRRVLKMFHLLPLIAVAIVFVLLASGGQLREIYVSYLEDTATSPWLAVRVAAAALGFALISAILYETHYMLNTLRPTPIYSVNAELGARSRLRRLQDMMAIALALSPWVGLAAGLLNAKVQLVRQLQILTKALNNPAYPPSPWTAADMQHVPMPSAGAVIFAVLVLGIVLSILVAANPKAPRLQQAVIVVTPAAAALLAQLLTDSPDFNPSPTDLALIYAAVAAATALYYFGYHRLYTIRAFVFSPGLQKTTGVNLRKHHRSLMFVWVLFPWLAILLLYFSFTPAEPEGAVHGWAIIPVAMSWVISIGLFVAFLLYRFRESAKLQITICAAVGLLAAASLLLSFLASADTVVTVYRALGPLATLALELLFVISIFALLALLSQRSGFPVLTLVVAVVVCTVLLPIPVPWSVGTVIVLCAFVLLMALVSRFWAVAGVACVLAVTAGINYFEWRGGHPVDLRSADARQPTLQQQFESWLNYVRSPRPETANGGSTASAVPFACPATAKYPVFIFAVEGGGIYAASAASLLLARLQDANPCFSRHLFAISAVSGGAIGASIFQALDQSQIARPSAAKISPMAGVLGKQVGSASTADKVASEGCLPSGSDGAQSTAGKLCAKVSEILQADHFSPVIAAIFPQMLGFARAGRADELAASFEQSVQAQDTGAAQDLDGPFLSHWSTKGGAPALVLNATWVETGFRAAFAPFPLHAIDESLYSFLDPKMPDLVSPSHPISLIQAAVVSARFPGVLPPFSTLVENRPAAGDSDATTYWNFVDGGYADSSGATTALALYNALKPIAAKDNADLRLILLTSSDPQPKPSDIHGTSFGDVMGPIDAILSVRDGLANEAVARACDGIDHTGETRAAAKDCNDPGPKSNLQIVGVDDQTYGLALGWKISQTTFEVVSWMLGDPDNCDGTSALKVPPRVQEQGGQTSPAGKAQPTVNAEVRVNRQLVQRNSCVLHNILALVDGTAN